MGEEVNYEEAVPAVESSRESDEQVDLPGVNNTTVVEDDGTEFVRAHFEQVAHANNDDELSKTGFKQLLNLLNKKGGIDTVPKDSDLEKAWIIADIDKSGTVDLDEFMTLYELIKDGLVDGLGKKSKWSFNSSKGKAELKQRRQSFKDNLEIRRKKNLQKSRVGDGENQLRQQQRGRTEASQTLAIANNEWKQRVSDSNGGKNVTVPQDIGNLSRGTEASAARKAGDKEIGATELEMKNQKGGRQHASNTLAIAKNEWEGRDKITIAQNIGHYGNETEAGKHRYDEMTVDNTGSAEMHILNQKNGRQNASILLSDAKDAWESRDKVTIVQDIGNLGNETEAGKHRHDKISVENSGSAEIEILNRRNGRRQTSLTLSKAKDEWEGRDKATVAQDIGNLATETEAGKHRRDSINEDNTSAAELDILHRKNARNNMSKDLSRNKNEFSKRADLHREKAKAKFEEIDTDHSGGLDLEELRESAHLLKIDPADVDNIFYEIDTNHDGTISLKEFLVYIGNMKTNTKSFKNAAKHTESSKRFTDKKSAFVSSIEKDAKAAKESRSSMSDALQDAKAQWELRQYKSNAKSVFNKQSSGVNPSSPRADLRSSEDKAIAKAREEQLRQTIAKRKANKSNMESDDHQNSERSNKVTLSQLKDAAPTIKISVEEVEAIFEQLDSTKSGEVNIEEFMALYSEMSTTSMTLVTKPSTFRAAAHTKSSLKFLDKSSKYSSAIENNAKSAAESRKHMSGTLASAKNEWETRQLKSQSSGSSMTTKPKDISSKTLVDSIDSKKRYNEKAIAEARKELMKRSNENRLSIGGKKVSSPRKKVPMKKKTNETIPPPPSPDFSPVVTNEKQGPLWFVPGKVAFWRDPGNNSRGSKSPAPTPSPVRQTDSPATAYSKRYRTIGSSDRRAGTPL